MTRKVPDNFRPLYHSGIIDAVQDEDPKDRSYVAKVDEFKPAEIGEIEIKKEEPVGDYLHQVAMQVHDDTFNPKPHVKTEEEEDFDRKQSAVDLSENVMEYERMSYGAKDLNDFAALTTQQAKKALMREPSKLKRKLNFPKFQSTKKTSMKNSMRDKTSIDCLYYI